MQPHERLKQLRKQMLKMTQKEFSQKINVSRPNLSNIEKGRISLTERVLQDICREFGVSVQWLKLGEEPVFQEMAQEDAEVINRIAEIYHKLTERNRDYLAGYIARLLEEQEEEH